jgi:hypothetical protein
MTVASQIADDPAHWRQRAQEARREAEQIDDPSIKSALLEIAAAYERLAAIIETGSASERA